MQRAGRASDIPLSQHPLLKTSDIDEAKAMAQRLYGMTDVRVSAGRKDFHWEVNRTALGSIGIAAGWIPLGGCIAKPPGGDRYFLSLARGGGAEAASGGAPISIAPGRAAMIVSPQQPCRLDIAEGYATLTLSIDRSSLEAHFFKLTQTPLRQPLCFESQLDVSRGPGAGLLRLVEFIVRELDQPDGLHASPLLRTSLNEALLTALLTCAQHDQSHELAAKTAPVLPGYVRRAEAYIDAHAGGPLTVPDVAAAVGVSVRALQAGFRQYRDSSPKAFLKSRRLDRARAQLLRGAPELTVGAAASAAGYSHASRFAADYKLRFGESPSQTLHAAKGR